MPRRVIGLVSFAPASEPRVRSWAQAFADRGDRVVWFGPPDGSEVPDGVRRIDVGGQVSDPPRLREILRFASALAVRIAAQAVRARFDTFIVHGGEEALAVLGAMPRLTGAHVVLDLDADRARVCGPVGVLASLARGPALRLIDAATASDAATEGRLRARGMGEVVRWCLDPDLSRIEPRSTQPRVTVKSHPRLLVDAPSGTPSYELEAAVKHALELEPQLEIELAGGSADDARAFEARVGGAARACPRYGEPQWRARMEEVHLALWASAEPREVGPLLAVGIPVVTLGPAPLADLTVDDELCLVSAPDPQIAGEALARLGRSSRDRRELIKAGWRWVEARRAQGTPQIPSSIVDRSA